MHRRLAKQRSSPALSTSALLTGTQPTATTEGSREKILANTSLNLLISALKITKEVSSASPQLRLAVGALLTVLEACKGYSEATEAIETLLSRIQPLNDILEKVRSNGNCPQALKNRLTVLASKVEVVVRAAKEVQSKPRTLQLTNSANYTEKTESWMKMLDWHIRSFVLEGTIMLELTVNQEIISMNSRFDQVFVGINELRDHLNILAQDQAYTRAPNAYCIHISALYRNLRPVIEADLHSGSSVHVQCHENTRMEVLATLCSWLHPDHPRLATLPAPVVPALSDRSIVWLHALAGSGKSTIAMTVAGWWDKDELLGASYFCARDGQRSNINCIFRTIAYQLAVRFPVFREHLTKILEAHPNLWSSTPTRQLEKLIVEPLEAVRSDAKSVAPFPAHVAVVIDALDECTDNNVVSTILKSLALYIGQLSPLKFLITSRLEENITQGFLLQSLDENTHRLALHKIPEDLTKRDISLFLRSRLAAIGNVFDLGASWPTPERLENLVDLSELLFVFAALAARYIEDEAERDPDGRLRSLLDAGNEAAAKRGISTSTFPILDALYIQVLGTAAKRLGDALKAPLKLVIGTIVLAEQPLSPATLNALLGLPTGTVRRVLPVFGAILTIPDREDNTTPIGIIHLSFPNFLVDPTRCTDQGFLVRPRIQHSHITFRCLSIMNLALKYNILGVASEHDCILNSEISDLSARLSQRIPAPLEYACRYWTTHLCKAEIGEDLLTALEEFCTSHLLHWLEVLSLLGCIDGVVEALQSAQACLKLLRATDVPSLLYDCERAVRAFYAIISTSAMHMYSTVFLFSPRESPIRPLAAGNTRPSLVAHAGLENAWSATRVLRVIDKSPIETLAFSPDGMYVACAKWHGTIQLVNAHTGAELQVLKSRADGLIQGLSFSPTSKELLSGSDDGTVDLWDVTTGANLNTWKAHSDWVCSVAWSPDGTLAASASIDSTIRVWRVAFPERTAMVLQQHDGCVCHVLFASDGNLLSGSADKTCKVWDTRSTDWDMEASIQPTQTLKHDLGVLMVAVSSDSCLVACGLSSGKIILWTMSDGQQVQSLPDGSEVISLAFYPNGLLAAAYTSSPFTLWDVRTGAPVKTASNERARAAAFASDGLHVAHATNTHLHIHLWSLEFWQNTIKTTSIAGKVRQLARHSSIEDRGPRGIPLTFFRAAATSPARKLIIAVYKSELRAYEISTGCCIHTIDHPIGDNPSATWSPTGRLFACTGESHEVHVWKVDTGVLVGSFAGYSEHVTDIVFTHDEQHILSASGDGTIRRGKIEQTRRQWSFEIVFQSDGDWILALAVSSDGRWFLSASSRHASSPPDTSSADLLVPPSRRPVVGENGHYHSLRLHDTTTGHIIWIQHHPCKITSVAFSEDCTRALAGNEEGEVFLYDLTQIIPPDPTVPHSPPPLAVPEHKLSGEQTQAISRLSFSPDGGAVVTDRTYSSIPSELQLLPTRPVDRSLTTIYFYEGDWLWCINHPDSDRRRLCWIPPLFRPRHNGVESSSSAGGQLITYTALQLRSLVVMHGASAC